MLNQLRYNILITGATGFLGSSIVKKLVLQNNVNKIFILKRKSSKLNRINCLLNNFKVFFVDLELFNYSSFFIDNNIDIILHCATNYGRDNNKIEEILNSNLILPLKLLYAGMQNNVKFFINTDTVIPKDVNSYSLSKKQFLEWMQCFAKNICCINIQLEHFYGPFDNKNKFTTMIFDSLYANVEKIPLTKGEQSRHFIYIDDVVEAFITIINSLYEFNDPYYDFQVSSEKSITIHDFCEITKKIIGNRKTLLDFGAIDYRKNELMNCITDTTALNNLGWHQNISLIDGISKTLKIEGKIK